MRVECIERAIFIVVVFAYQILSFSFLNRDFKQRKQILSLIGNTNSFILLSIFDY